MINILAILFSIEFGFLPIDNFELHQTWKTENYNNYYMENTIELSIYDIFYLGGDTRITASNINIKNFYLSEIWFNFFLTLKFKGFEIGFRHFCEHPLMPYISKNGIGEIIAEGAYEEIYIKYTAKVGIF